MSIQTWTFLLISISFMLYLLIALRTRAHSTMDFYVAGSGVPPIINGMATAADWMSAAAFISMAGLISFIGYEGGVYLMGWTGGYVLLALCVAPYLRKFGQYTVPDFIGDRYYSQTARFIAVICVIFISFTYIAGQMRGVGIVFSRFLEVDITWGTLIGTGIVFFYAVLGGMKSITYTQVAQYCVLITAYLIPAIFISILVTGHLIPQVGFGSKLADGSNLYLLEKLDGLSQELGFAAYTSSSKSSLDMFFITAALMAGTAGLPHVIVRFYTVPSVQDARKSALWALIFVAVLQTTAPALASFTRLNMINTLNGPSQDGVLYTEAPSWVKNWQHTTLISWEDKNGDHRMFYSGDQRNEMKIDRDIMVLANPEIAKLPGWVIALVAAGGIAAALSTSAGLLLVISTAISHDLLKKNLTPKITEWQELALARFAAALAVCVAAYLGIHPPGFVAQVVALAFGLAASSFFPAIILGIFYKRMNKEGAIAGMLVGISFTIAYIFYFKFISPEHNTAEHWFMGISPEGIGTLGMLMNVLVALTVCYFTAPPPHAVQRLVESLRYPEDHGGPEENDGVLLTQKCG